MKKFFFYVLLQLICFQITRAQENVIPGEFPDPSIVEVNGVYYACGSSNDWGPVFPVYKSTDLRNWTFLCYVFNEAPAWTSNSYWAPELYYHNGKFYCYYTARRKDGISCIGVATTNNIEQGFQDKGVLVEWGNEAIDAFVYRENEKLFITWKAYGLTQGRPIQVLGSELSPDGLSLKGEAFTILTAEKDSWEAGGIEGQCVIKNNGYLYMLYSGNGCCGGGCNYQVGVARAKTMKGPWEKYTGNPLLKSNADWKCPGHGTALKTKDTWAYLYHAYPAAGFPFLGRTALMSEIAWNKDGWPSFKPAPAGRKQGVLSGDHIQDSFNGDKLAPWWRYDVASYNFDATIKEGTLHLTEVRRNEKNHTGTALCVNPSVGDFSISTKIIGKNQALKGLVLYATHANSVGIGVKQDTIVVWDVRDGKYSALNRAVVKDASAVYLKAMVTGARYVTFFYSLNNRDWVQIHGIDGTNPVNAAHLQWWSWGLKAGLFVKTDPATADNKAVFDEFSISHSIPKQ